MSPEVIDRKREFNAKANDIWCVGVCLLKLILGYEPWYKAEKGDFVFDLVINGKLDKILKKNKKQHWVNHDLLKLLNGFFRYEHNRINIEQIKKCKWFKM